MNKPRDRVENKVNDLFTAIDRLTRTIENNRSHLDDADLENIKKAIHYKIQILVSEIDNPKESFKL